MATRAKPGKKKSKKREAPSQATDGAIEATLAYDAELLNQFVLGNITLGELEGVPKNVQYDIADRGFKLMSEGKLADAEKVFRGLITLDPFDSYFHTALGSIFQRSDRKDEAIEEYGRALKVNPYNATALANRGEIFFQQGRVLEATQDIQAAIEADPEGKEPATVRGRVLAMALAKTIEDNRERILATMAKAGKKKAGGKKTSKKSSASSAGKKSSKKTKA